jgi:nitrogen-specific signal transduction histidine kinase
MSAWFAMPRGAAAVRQAALAELRATLGAIKSAARLLGDACPTPPSRSLVRAISRAAARAERAVARLERPPKNETAGASFRTARRLRTGYPESGD